ncbi:FxsA family protein [Mycobacterium interjectum]|uniref:FxsA family protein n=1 Tax=Mycobacterium interjectum TaxID=33895 RepID=UPI000832944C|nr:FxsA family protein [Mycobacterium interjectum]MCV7088548.1 FxsA family protein [Mycobacterium interjectum]
MLSRLFLIYAVTELAAVIALVSTVGWGWTLLALLATSLLGWGVLAPMAGSQLVRQLRQLRSDPNAVSDGTMVTLATVLILLPGLVTTALGLLLLVPPIRSLARPGLAALGVRGLRRRMPLITDARLFGADGRAGYPGDGPADYIDGEVIDVREFRPPALPNEMRGGFPGHPGWD